MNFFSKYNTKKPFDKIFQVFFKSAFERKLRFEEKKYLNFSFGKDILFLLV